MNGLELSALGIFIAIQCLNLFDVFYLQVLFALDQTLKQHERRRSKSETMPDNDDLIRHYNCGDLKSVLFKKDTLKVTNALKFITL